MLSIRRMYPQLILTFDHQMCAFLISLWVSLLPFTTPHPPTPCPRRKDRLFPSYFPITQHVCPATLNSYETLKPARCLMWAHFRVHLT